MMRHLLVCCALLWSHEAHTSGSSTVTATGAHVRVSITSVRKIFAGGEGESEWHADWKREHQGAVDAALPKVEAVVGAAGLSLAAWDEALPEAWHEIPADQALSPEQVCASRACRVRFRLPASEVEVEVAFAGLVPAADRAALVAAIAEGL